MFSLCSPSRPIVASIRSPLPAREFAWVTSLDEKAGSPGSDGASPYQKSFHTLLGRPSSRVTEVSVVKMSETIKSALPIQKGALPNSGVRLWFNASSQPPSIGPKNRPKPIH
jgi:hypothetical protein